MSHQNTISNNKVVTITLNPALDLTGGLDTLNIGSVSLATTGSLHAAGKGVNVAKVLSDLGAEVTVTGFLGRDNEALFCTLFREMNAQDEFIRVDGSTRINVKLVEKNGQVSDINFPGVEVSEQAINEFEHSLFKLAETHQFFVLAGSLPKGISPKLCASWIEKLHQMGKKVIFDSSRAALAAGLDAHPWLIKPNDEELSEFVGRELSTAEACQQATQDLASKGIDNIVVSLGAKGVMWLGKNDQSSSHSNTSSDAQSNTSNNSLWRYAQPPKMNVVSTVGAGDTLVAGLCWGHMQQWQAEQTLSFATALSALAVTQVGVGVPSLEAVTNLQKMITHNNPISSNV